MSVSPGVGSSSADPGAGPIRCRSMVPEDFSRAAEEPVSLCGSREGWRGITAMKIRIRRSNTKRRRKVGFLRRNKTRKGRKIIARQRKRYGAYRGWKR